MASRPIAPGPGGGSSARPLSPHLTIWKWRVHMAVSIAHRITGNALAFGGALLFAWWLAALAGGPAYYRLFQTVIEGPAGWLVGIGLTWAVFQHMASGIRHFIMDAGEGYDLATSRRMAQACFVFAILATIAFWAWVLAKGF